MKITETIIDITSPTPFTWEFFMSKADILLPNDNIFCEYVDEFRGSVEEYDAHYHLVITRERDRTPEEIAEYERQRAEFEERRKKMRYKDYLKLKAEFDENL